MPLWSSSSNPNSGDPYAPPNDGDGSDFNAILAPYKPLIKTLSLSSLMGYCSAIAAKRIGKHVAFIAGMGFIVLQGLVHKRFIDVNWKEVEKSVADAVDTDNDGQITEADIKRYLEKAKKILTNNIPDASGFGLGFMFGLRG